MDYALIIEALLWGVAMGFLICFTGVGAGVLVVPIISLFFGLPTSAAIGTASIYSTLTKIAAGIEHVRIRNVNYALFRAISVSAVPGILISAIGINATLTYYPQYTEAIQAILTKAVVAAIALSLVLVLFQAEKKIQHVSSRWAHVIGFFIGLLMGTTGIGGGVLIVPALFLIGKETPKRVVGTSIAVALLLSGVTAIIYAGGGQADYTLALLMVAGSLIGIPLGSLGLRRASQTFLRYCVIITIAAALIISLLVK